MLDKQDLVKLATLTMPFGKYRGRLLIDDLSLDLLEKSPDQGPQRREDPDCKKQSLELLALARTLHQPTEIPA